MQTRGGQLGRIGVLSVCVVAASHDDRDAVVVAQQANGTQNGVVTGELVMEPPTRSTSASSGLSRSDDNGNAAVQVSYRKRGEAAWSPALPLLRLQREGVFVGPQFDVVAPNMFAGSILDLEPDADYEARFVMTDPDGVGRGHPDRDREDAGGAGPPRG